MTFPTNTKAKTTITFNMSSLSHVLCLTQKMMPCYPLIASTKLKPDMVLEDVESDNEGQQTCEDHSKAPAQSTSLTPPTPTTYQQQEAIQQTQPNSLQSDANPQSVTKTFQEDAETQTGRWTPFIESIKREAEDVALATMEER